MSRGALRLRPWKAVVICQRRLELVHYRVFEPGAFNQEGIGLSANMYKVRRLW
jgi:hypothetical protein